MKKAKIMLTAIAVIAVIGGILAFKAKSFANVYCKFPGGAITCQKVAYTTAFRLGITTTDPCIHEDAFYTEDTCFTPVDEINNTVTETDL